MPKTKQPGPLQGDHFQAWRTPRYVFDAFNEAFRFDVDAAADDDNALCRRYFTQATDGLRSEWPEAARVWCNPPYADCGAWVTKALHEVTRPQGAELAVLLLRCDTSTHWFAEAMRHGTVVFFRGRIQFELPPGMVNHKRSSIANVAVIFSRGQRVKLEPSILDARTMETVK